MNKRFLFILPFLFLTIFSCGLKNTLLSGRTGDVSLTMTNKVLGQITANARAADETENEVKIKVFLTGDFEDEDTQTVDLSGNVSKLVFEFKDIPEGATVTANMSVTKGSDDKELYTGKSDPVTIEAGKVTPVTITLKVAKGAEDEVPPLIPTVQIFFGEETEPLETANLIKIFDDFYYAADTTVENYNYYAKCAPYLIKDDFVTVKVENWDEAYTFKLNGTELKVSEDKTLDFVEVLKNTKAGENSITVAKGEDEATEVYKYSVVNGKFDVGDFEFYYGKTTPDTMLGEGKGGDASPIRIGVEAGKASSFCLQVTLTGNKTLPAGIETKYTAAVLGGKVYTVTQPTAEVPYAVISIPADEVAKIGAGAEMTIPEEYCTDLLKEGLALGGAGCFFKTSYDVTSKGYAYWKSVGEYANMLTEDEASLGNQLGVDSGDYEWAVKSLNMPHQLFFISEKSVNENLNFFYKHEESGWTVNSELLGYCGPANDYTFDKNGSLWFITVSNSLTRVQELTSPEEETADDRSFMIEIDANLISCDVDNELLYVARLSETSAEIVVCDISSKNPQSNDMLNIDFPEISGGRKITAMAAYDGALYFAGHEYSSTTGYRPVIYKYVGVINQGEKRYTLQNKYSGVPKEFNDFSSELDVVLTDLEVIGDEVYATVRQSYNTYSRGAVLKFDLNLQYIQTTGWVGANRIKITIPLHMSKGSDGSYSLSSSSFANLKWDTAQEPGYSGFVTYEYTTDPVYVPKDMEKAGFFGPERIAAIKPKKLIVADNGSFIYAEDRYACYWKRITSFTTVDMENFAAGIETRSRVAPTDKTKSDIMLTGVMPPVLDLSGRHFIYNSACSDKPEDEEWENVVQETLTFSITDSLYLRDDEW